jgi:pSer/pThr/pTyr-binding forkhead associated (FHA) protein
MRAQLVPLTGGAPIEVGKDMTLVGRGEECDVRLEHKSVSKMHCVIVKTDGLLLIRDLGSTNGTRVNGTRVRRAALLPNDQVSIAHYKFRVYLGPDAPEEVHADDHTQHLNSYEVADLLRQARGRPEKDEESDDSARPGPGDGEKLQRNQLPDEYPEDSGRSSQR